MGHRDRQKLTAPRSPVTPTGSTSVAFTSDDTRLVTASADGTVRLWNVGLTSGRTRRVNSSRRTCPPANGRSMFRINPTSERVPGYRLDRALPLRAGGGVSAERVDTIASG